MKNSHEITLKQYAAQYEEQPLPLGTAGSYGMEMLTIIREGVRGGVLKDLAAFHPPVGAAVQVRVGANNQIGVPIEATAEKGMGKIVFAGYKEGVRQVDCGRRTVQGGAVLWCERHRTRRTSRRTWYSRTCRRRMVQSRPPMESARTWTRCWRRSPGGKPPKPTGRRRSLPALRRRRPERGGRGLPRRR